MYISDLYKEELCFVCERYSKNDKPEFTDEEILAVYLFSVLHEQRFKIKQIHQFAKDYLISWFPKLPSYVAFNNRLNRLSECFRLILNRILTATAAIKTLSSFMLLDSMPIITCSGKRQGRVACDITDKTYCATKGIWYYGLKMHVLGFKQKGTLPLPESIVLTPASENDLNIFKLYWSDYDDANFFGDKIYHDVDYFDQMFSCNNSTMLTPVKGIKGQTEEIKQWDRAANDLFSTAVSRVRQPIESLFNWINEKSNIQKASYVRSTKGLLVHVFGKLAAAFLGLVINS